MCNQCEENEWKLLVDRPTDSSKANYALPSSKRGIKIKYCSELQCFPILPVRRILLVKIPSD
jgi:hypothetical protein